VRASALPSGAPPRTGATQVDIGLAAEMVPVFTSRHIHREALAALTFFRQAVEAEKAGADLVARVAAYLRRAEGDPGLSFESGSGAA
jgi:hypothetical protein